MKDNSSLILTSKIKTRKKMQLQTDRLILREYTMNDFTALYEIMSDAETMQHYPAPSDEARTRRWTE